MDIAFETSNPCLRGQIISGLAISLGRPTPNPPEQRCFNLHQSAALGKDPAFVVHTLLLCTDSIVPPLLTLLKSTL